MSIVSEQHFCTITFLAHSCQYIYHSLSLSLIVCVLFYLIYLLEYFIQDTFYMTSHYLTNNKLAQWNEIECYSCLLFLSTFIWVFVCATCDSLRQWLKAPHLLTRANCTAVLFKAILFLSSFIAFWWMLCASFIQSFPIRNCKLIPALHIFL